VRLSGALPDTVTECSDLDRSGLLQSFLDGEVDAGASLRVVAHLNRCEDCAEVFYALQVVKRALRRQRAGDPEAVARLCTFVALLTRSRR
jgi:anti-sigma factor RsiW